MFLLESVILSTGGGGLCLGGLCQGDAPQTETLPRMVKIGRYASYWNAFLFALFPYFLCIGCGCGVNCRLTSLKITLEDSDIDITETLKYLDLLIVSLNTRVHERRIVDFPGGIPKGGATYYMAQFHRKL